jgi:predicted ATP-grasp superfamily ATP-dependent carboligase
MRVLIFEHICSGGLSGHDLDQRLVAKGGAMLRGLVEDFFNAGYDVTTLLDARMPYELPGKVVRVAPGSDAAGVNAFEAALKTVDAAMVVAPEFADLLPGWLARVEKAGVKNLGSKSDAVRLTSDKHGLGLYMQSRAVRMPHGGLGLTHLPAMLARHGQAVVKPNFGAGCIDTFVCRSESDAARLPKRDDWLVQEKVQGLAASVAFVVPDAGEPIALRAGKQAVAAGKQASSDDAGFALNYAGGEMPLAPELEARAIALGKRALAQVPGLRGCVGLDLVLADAPEGDCLIEINPRPTVAYTGLRQLADFSLADLIAGRPVEVRWKPGGVRYQADGSWERVG